MKNKSICLIFSFLLLTANTNAAELCGQAKQGEIVVGLAPGATEASLGSSTSLVDQDGVFLLAFGRDEQKSPILSIRDGKQQTNYTLDISEGAWDIQNIKGIPPRKVNPSDSDLRDIEVEQKVVRAAQETKNMTPFWKRGFIMPVEGRISGEFGGQRIMNGVKKNPHAGMDIAAKAGTEIKASSDGVVTLAQPDLFYSGNVIIIDHGYGLHTIYAHMQEMKVKRGDIVKQGDIIGLVGQTGRATGPHLHWGASANGTKFNPTSLLNINTADKFCFTL